ncbi:helix-turn-helix domain-containing protein [Paenibacillus mendelii]|uniref:Helix-turn-helix domain-containing protein n=1 Tax=Paenibacillus mendelii TaxID=206163 RepID=A0ABV6J2S1_9BACL|nr:helix-turn-helix domain-containing protein [Paenibacillus mendelii]MCQ6559278.1 helix-turn-helix domain-containing protein [Paenibacillus mendelii]
MPAAFRGAASLAAKIRTHWSHFKSKLLVKYALSYIVIFLVPLTGVTIFVYENAVSNLRSEIEQSNVNQLSQVKMTIDGHMSDLYEIASRISYDEHLTPYMASHPYHSREAITTLANYTANSSIVEELFLSYHGSDHIYSYKGMTDASYMFNRVYKYQNWDSGELLKALHESTQPFIRPAEEVSIYSRQETLLTLMIPIKPNDPYPYGTVMFLLKESKLTGIMDSILNRFSGSSFIFDPDGQVLTRSTNGKSLSGGALVSLSGLKPGIHSIKLDGEQNSVVVVRSQENGWGYVTTMPTYQFFERVAHIQTLILLVFAITVVTGIIAAMFLAKRQYHPIKNLMEFARLQSGGEAVKIRNEWEWISHTIRDYDARINMQEPFVRNQCLMLLLKHGKPDDPEIERMVRDTGLERPGSEGAYFSVVLAWEDSHEDDPQRTDQLLHQELLSQVEFPELNALVYGVEFSVRDRFVLMVSLPAESPETQKQLVLQVLDAITIMLLDHSHTLPYIGVGTLYSTLSDINQSFVEASTALEYRVSGSHERITHFEQLHALQTTAQETFWLSKKSVLKLEQSLKQGNEAVTLPLIAGMIEEIKQERLAVPVLRLICYDLLNTLLRTAADLRMNQEFGSIPSLTSFETLEEFELMLVSLASRICQQAQRNTETDQPSLIDDIVLYVEQNFADYTLSLEHIALKFSVSTSYLSRSFKEKTAINFSQYMWQLRINKAMQLLVTTSDPLQIIIESVGYLDAPNFIRKFKKETGMTPGQYRKQNSGSSKADE